MKLEAWEGGEKKATRVGLGYVLVLYRDNGNENVEKNMEVTIRGLYGEYYSHLNLLQGFFSRLCSTIELFDSGLLLHAARLLYAKPKAMVHASQNSQIATILNLNP